jgi:hypothetical protein
MFHLDLKIRNQNIHLTGLQLAGLLIANALVDLGVGALLYRQFGC